MKKKVRLIPRMPFLLLSILVAFAMVFTGCGSTPSSTSEPASSDPASSEPASSVVQIDAPQPEPLSPFDEHVTDYQTLNDVLLIDADASIKEDFFNELYLQDYGLAEAKQDREAVTDANAALLEEFIDYLSTDEHTECGFDIEVNQLLSDYEGFGYTEEETIAFIYEHLDTVLKITPDQIEQWGCTNRLAPGYIEYYNEEHREPEMSREEMIRALEEEQKWFMEHREEIEQQLRESAAETEAEAAKDREEAQQWLIDHWDEIGSDMN